MDADKTNNPHACFKRYWRDRGGNFTTLPQYFREHGYLTIGSGKIFHPGAASGNCDVAYSWSAESLPFDGASPPATTTTTTTTTSLPFLLGVLTCRVNVTSSFFLKLFASTPLRRSCIFSNFNQSTIHRHRQIMSNCKVQHRHFCDTVTPSCWNYEL